MEEKGGAKDDENKKEAPKGSIDQSIAVRKKNTEEQEGGSGGDGGAQLPRLPPASSLPPSLRTFLDQQFQTSSDLSKAPLLAAQLSSECESMEQDLSQLQTRILQRMAAWASQSQLLSASLANVSMKIEELRTSTAPPSVAGMSGAELAPSHERASSEEGLSTGHPLPEKQDLLGELPMLVKEVARVERVRLYAETALRLEALVGDMEDAVAAVSMTTPRISLPRKMANSPPLQVLAATPRKLSAAVDALQATEDAISQTSKSRPQWKRLFSAVDVRVDHAVAKLRPALLADYRGLLAALKWPPQLTAAGVQENDGESMRTENPLLEMQGDVKARFEESFLALSILQAVQIRRRQRQQYHDQVVESSLSSRTKAVRFQGVSHELLWTMDELVAPIASRAKYHFLKWSEKPELIFALAYRIAQQYMTTVDEVLQPMLDKARLVGYIVRDEWVSAMLAMVAAHLRSHAVPPLARSLGEEVEGKKAAALWLHMVDLSMSFDKRMCNLALRSAGPLSARLDMEPLEDVSPGLESNIRCISVFAERADWLELWTQLEFNDAQVKLRIELGKERAWLPDDRSDLSLGVTSAESKFVLEDSRAPVGAETAMSVMWAAINRCRTLPRADWQLVFVRSTAAVLVKGYLAELLRRCQEAEALTALVQEDAIVKVAFCINAAHYCEHKLREWTEDIFFLELRLTQILAEREHNDELVLDNAIHVGSEALSKVGFSSLQGCVFDEEIVSLSRFQTEWLGKLVSTIQRVFDASCQEYQRNKKRWQDESTSADVVDANSKLDVSPLKVAVSQSSAQDGWRNLEVSVSPSLVDALAILQSRLRTLKSDLADVIFMDLWRSLASGLDQFIFNTVILGGAKFSEHGSCQLARDVQALLQLFKPYCVRPSSFFPNVSDAVRLLTLSPRDVVFLLRILTSSSDWRFREQAEADKIACLKQHGVKFLSVATAEKILTHRILARV